MKHVDGKHFAACLNDQMHWHTEKQQRHVQSCPNRGRVARVHGAHFAKAIPSMSATGVRLMRSTCGCTHIVEEQVDSVFVHSPIVMTLAATGLHNS